MPTAFTPSSVSVVIPVREGVATLSAAVASAQAQAGVHEIVIAVGPSGDGTSSLAESLARDDPRIRIVLNPAGTTPAGLNAGIAASAGDVIVRLDAHAELPLDYVEMAVDTLRETGAGNVGGRQVPVARRGFAAAVAAAMRSSAGAGGATYRTGSRAGPADTVYLGVFRRDALEQVGLFDERLLRNQDYELNHRLREGGWQVWFDPRLEVTYRPRGSLGALARQYFEYGRWKRLVVLEHPSSVRLRQLAPPVLVLVLVAALAVGAATTWWLPAGLVAGYAAGLLVAGAAADMRRAPLVALALATMHLAWGIGFFVGPPRQDAAPQAESG